MPSLNKIRSGKGPKIDLLELGPGPRKGPAYNAARALEQRRRTGRIVAVGYGQPDYASLKNLNYIRTGILQHLETIPPESVRNIREDFVFHDVGTIEGRGLIKGYGKLIKEMKKTVGFMQTGHMASKPTNLNASNKYIRLVKQALVPGGHFIVTAGDQNADRVATELRENGF
ncbi:MAG: hypothetical protein Q7R47_06320, partial [Candidatus Diapherotrites archaeon]|nr:hypothetical protein [Candidatus Diapherotrites archaeon]